MNLKNAKNWSRSGIANAWVGTALILWIAFALRFILHPLVMHYAPYQLFILACVLIEYMFGLVPALVATAICLVGMEYFFVKPYFEFNHFSSLDFILIGNFVVITCALIALVEYLRRSLYSQQLQLKVSRSNYKLSLLRENDRAYFSRRSEQALAVLERLLSTGDDLLMLKFGAFEPKIQPLLHRLLETGSAEGREGDVLQQRLHIDDLDVLTVAFNGRVAGKSSKEPLRLRLLDNAGAVIKVVSAQIETFDVNGRFLHLLRALPAADGSAGSLVARPAETVPQPVRG